MINYYLAWLVTITIIKNIQHYFHFGMLDSNLFFLEGQVPNIIALWHLFRLSCCHNLIMNNMNFMHSKGQPQSRTTEIRDSLVRIQCISLGPSPSEFLSGCYSVQWYSLPLPQYRPWPLLFPVMQMMPLQKREIHAVNI